jgi:hypothetical protein
MEVSSPRSGVCVPVYAGLYPESGRLVDNVRRIRFGDRGKFPVNVGRVDMGQKADDSGALLPGESIDTGLRVRRMCQLATEESAMGEACGTGGSSIEFAGDVAC